MSEERAVVAARFLIDAYSKRRPSGDAEPYALTVARAYLASGATGDVPQPPDVHAIKDAALEEAAKMALLYVRLMEQHAMNHDTFAALIAEGGVDEQIRALKSAPSHAPNPAVERPADPRGEALRALLSRLQEEDDVWSCVQDWPEFEAALALSPAPKDREGG